MATPFIPKTLEVACKQQVSEAPEHRWTLWLETSVGNTHAGVKHISHRVDIEEPPAFVDEKTQVDHWKEDTVYGQDGYFVTLVERVTKLLVVRRTKTKSKKEVKRRHKAVVPHQISIYYTVPLKLKLKTLFFTSRYL